MFIVTRPAISLSVPYRGCCKNPPRVVEVGLRREKNDSYVILLPRRPCGLQLPPLRPRPVLPAAPEPRGLAAGGPSRLVPPRRRGTDGSSPLLREAPGGRVGRPRLRALDDGDPAALRLLHRGALFFFQAEDVIRGFHVTGVQTCALPISVAVRRERKTQPVHELGQAEVRRTQLQRSEERRVGKECRSRRSPNN